MTIITERRFFTPVQIGPITLGHRAVMAPLTRSRSEQPGDIPGKLMAEYYTQRASEGGLIISEATSISITGRGWFGAPGMYSDEQVAGWKKITDSVHAKGGHMFSQLWHVGRSSHVSMTNGATPVAPSVVPEYWQNSAPSISTPSGWLKPSPHRALDISEIPGIVEDYRKAAERAKAARFDGVELHAANGYLPDEFLQDGTNKRRDAYGGTVAKRARLPLEVVEAFSSVFGASRVGVRVSPSGRWGGISDSNPEETFGNFAEKLNDFGLAYLHIIEPRVMGVETLDEHQLPVASQFLRQVFTGPIIAAGGFTRAGADAILKAGDADLVAFGRFFTSNPDLPERLRRNLPLTPYVREAFWGGTELHYTDFESYREGVAA